MLLLVCCLLNAQVPPCQTIEVNVVAARPDRSTRRIFSSEGRRVFLTGKPLLTNNDFTHATVSLTEGQFVLNLDMTADSARRVQTFTRNNVGKEMAFLVNGQLIRMPKIRDPIAGNGFLIGAFAQDEARKLAEAVNHRENLCGPQLKALP